MSFKKNLSGNYFTRNPALDWISPLEFQQNVVFEVPQFQFQEEQN